MEFTIFNHEVKIEVSKKNNKKSKEKIRNKKSELTAIQILCMGLTLLLLAYVSETYINTILDATFRITRNNIIYLYILLIAVLLLGLGNIKYTMDNKKDPFLSKYKLKIDLFLVVVTMIFMVIVHFFNKIKQGLNNFDGEIVYFTIAIALTLYIFSVFYLLIYTFFIIFKNIKSSIDDTAESKNEKQTLYVAWLTVFVAMLALIT